ncbi:MAG: hypothetical protein CMF39_01825 [Legionellaceae bacterium]|nr:hypothetical protein [Legionellaceae bacterium]|tara:strand:+ start:561 stop:1388 length:828 start_codon:yes stop_codon:yes gene_type:complete
MATINYAGWAVDTGAKLATRHFSDDQNPTKIALSLSANQTTYEGWWPLPPDDYRSTVITGICLLDARWQLEFEKKGRGNPPSRRALTSPLERKKAVEKIHSGDRVTKMYVPQTLGKYHQYLIAWQVEKIELLKPKRILYHFPLLEYHYYLEQIEILLQRSLLTIHEAVEKFAHALKLQVKDAFVKKGLVAPEFISPFHAANGDPIKSFMMPYEKPEYFDCKLEDCVGVEDMNEIKLSHQAFKVHGIKIPVLAGLIGFPNCYLYSKSIDNTDCFCL